MMSLFLRMSRAHQSRTALRPGGDWTAVRHFVDIGDRLDSFSPPTKPPGADNAKAQYADPLLTALCSVYSCIELKTPTLRTLLCPALSDLVLHDSMFRLSNSLHLCIQ